ncbi:tripartite tricarboxylate transporter substrate binding protein [Limnohabitans sp. Rim8]|jgi:tripartite-type tricarboxylate transporter receptor subunit TctC|uniref:Bug family tripartite tricarboxylate transporter substrate binding protein n=1 Tax=Limnohabitans sp. Rim8 TaxID=1100718 RepID=UPI0025E31D94|nr:tripartite tricarboxylate transporter substrate binding protein [Limnohabitans sp. Rim8]
MKKITKRLMLVSAMACAILGATNSWAQAWPNKPIRMVVPLAPGGGTDIASRVVANYLSEALGQQVIIENKLGANGVVGVDFASKAAPDGYTILVGSTTTMAANNFMYKNPTVDPLKDFLPVSILGTIEFAMLVPASSNYNSLKDLIGAAKANPGKLSYGFGSSAALLCGEMFNAAAGIQIVKVPYKGTPQSLIDLAADRIQLVCEPLGPSLPLIKSGKLRPLAVTSVNRHGLAPEVPTMAEAGLPMEHATWAGFFVPAKTPKEIVTRLSNEIVKIMGRADAQEKIRETGFIPRQIGSDEFGAVHRNDYSRMERIIKQAGITPD